MNTDFKDVFGQNGPLARALPGYAYRPEQAAMANAVGAALARLEPLIVEAGTGTGKTFAYLVPALLSGRSVIISTGTRTLQDQLFRRDLPLLAKALGLPVKVALLKGRSNYLCRQRLEQAMQQGSLFDADRSAKRILGRIYRWAASTKSGDLSELSDLPEQSSVWPQVTSTRENCLGQECAQFQNCHIVEARRNAQAADIVIVNHHLLLADLALKDEGFGDLLPGAEGVILDEAHQVPDIAAQFFGRVFSMRQVQLLLRDAGLELAACGARAPSLTAAADELNQAIDQLRSMFPRAGMRIEWAALPDEFFDALPAFESALKDIASQLEGLGAGAGSANCARRATSLAGDLSALRDLPEDSGLRWVETNAQGLSLQFTPFEIAARLREYVDSRPCAWVFTSATLAIGENFSHFADRVGMADARTLRIDSPFDYATQARIFLPPRMPEPQSPAFAERFIEACAPLLEAGGGRAFLLYTSYRGLGEGVKALKARFPAAPFPILVQGEAPREALLTRFRELGNAVLLATGSFWEGVDVKGDALSIVAIDKLPFASPDDPLLKARLEGIRRRGGNPFLEYQLPQAVLTLKQGAGRLIRDFDDFGVILIGDPRITSKAYGRMFLQSLPASPVLKDGAAASQFLSDQLKALRSCAANVQVS